MDAVVCYRCRSGRGTDLPAGLSVGRLQQDYFAALDAGSATSCVWNMAFPLWKIPSPAAAAMENGAG